MLKNNIFLILSSLSFSLAAKATTLSLDTETSRGAFSGTIAADYTAIAVSNEALQFGGFGAYAGGDSVRSENTSTGEVTTTKTKNAGASLRLQFYDHTKMTFSGSLSETPETKYKENGGQVKMDTKLGKNFMVGALTGKSNIEQKYSLTILSRTYEREITLEKKYSGLILGYNYNDLFHVQLAATFYNYSKSKSDLQTAYQNQFLNNYLTDLVSSISGLPESTASADISYVYSDDNELSLYLQSSKLIVDDSNTQRIELMLTKYFEAISARIGVGQSKSKEGSSGSLLVGLDYDF